MRLIVGLGNPGLRYRSTRHNVGFRCVDLIARRWGLRFSERRARAVLARGERVGEQVVLAKPRTFMNNSGEGVAYLLTRFTAEAADLIVIYDDMELPTGRLRIRPVGSDGGHNGARSIIEALRTQDFPRIRVGIGPQPLGLDPVTHVLGCFLPEEATQITKAAQEVVDAVECIMVEGIDAAMNRFN